MSTPIWDAIGRRCGAVALGLAIDRVVGEPPTALHPVAAFGTAMTRFEEVVWADRRRSGVVYALVGVAGAWGIGRLVGATAPVTAAAVAGRELRLRAGEIGEHLVDDDLDAARAALPALVGRDPSTLDSSGVAAAVVESLAENAVDAVVAPVCWGLVGGAPGAAAYRAVNTMDAMVGHRSVRYRRFGWAAARLDDVANWVPARIYAVLVAAVRPDRARAVVALIRRDASAHPSPNAGVAETAMAAALGRSLGGPLRYGERQEDRPTLGDGPRPQADDVERARRVAVAVENVLLGVLAAIWLATRFGRR